jgi:hypothetical protein
MNLQVSSSIDDEKAGGYRATAAWNHSGFRLKKRCCGTCLPARRRGRSVAMTVSYTLEETKVSKVGLGEETGDRCC